MKIIDTAHPAFEHEVTLEAANEATISIGPLFYPKHPAVAVALLVYDPRDYRLISCAWDGDEADIARVLRKALSLVEPDDSE